MRKPQQRNPSIIDTAPISVDAVPDPFNEYGIFVERLGELSSKLEAAEAEVERLSAKKTIDEVRAEMMAPYADKVFWFVAIYCAAVGIMLTLSGFKAQSGFQLSDTILGIIAGSTAVSVIGLIGMVVSGLFGGAKHQAKRPTAKAK